MQAYAKAAQALRALEHPIDSGAQAKAIKGIGAGMANRIDAARLQEMHQESHSDRTTVYCHCHILPHAAVDALWAKCCKC